MGKYTIHGAHGLSSHTYIRGRRSAMGRWELIKGQADELRDEWWSGYFLRVHRGVFTTCEVTSNIGYSWLFGGYNPVSEMKSNEIAWWAWIWTMNPAFWEPGELTLSSDCEHIWPEQNRDKCNVIVVQSWMFPYLINFAPPQERYKKDKKNNAI